MAENTSNSPKTVKEFSSDFLSNRKVYGLFLDLFERWRDEAAYEDLGEYAQILQDSVTECGGGECCPVRMKGAFMNFSFAVGCSDGTCVLFINQDGNEYWGAAGRIMSNHD